MHFWPYAFSTAVYLINRLPLSNASTTSPWERLFHRRPSYNLFKPFGCLCYPLLRPYNSRTLQPRSVKCIFLGYATNAKGYICFDPKSRRYYTSRHVIFTESVFPFTKSPLSSSSSQISYTWLQTNLYFHECPLTSLFGTGPTSNTPSPPHILPSGQSSTEASSCSSQPESSSLLPSQSESSVNPTPTVAPSVPFTSTELVSTSSVAPPTPPLPHHPMQTRAKSGIFKPKRAHHTTAIDYLQTEPLTFKLASQFPQWCDAMTSEFAALDRQATWSLVPPSPSHNIVGSRWVYKLKRNSDGSIARYKACLVAKGYHQQHGMDYDETFSPVVKPATVRLVLSIATQQSWSLC